MVYVKDPVFVWFLMMFMHYIGDWVLQTDKVADLKQKKNWEQYGPKYKNDYISVLSIHAFSWSFCVYTPLLLMEHNYAMYWYIAILIINSIIHFIIDDIKANRKLINLELDQTFHMVQLVVGFIIWRLTM